MSIENSGDVSYAEVGGLSEQIRELREVSFSVCLQWHSLLLSAHLFLFPGFFFSILFRFLSQRKKRCRCGAFLFEILDAVFSSTGASLASWLYVTSRLGLPKLMINLPINR